MTAIILITRFGEIMAVMAADSERMAGWFAGPKAENGEWFGSIIASILADYYAWRKNYFPEDGAIVGSKERRESEPFRDEFEDRLMELLARLKADYPFQSPRYAAHMVAEQALPAIAGYFATMLYNPNNVSSEAAPVTVRLELEACRLISRMLGYGEDSWSHLTGGGTVANLEALWIARSVKYLPLVTQDMKSAYPVETEEPNIEVLLRTSPMQALTDFSKCFEAFADPQAAISAYLASPHNIAVAGTAAISRLTNRNPVVIVPETAHYCFDKAIEVLGIGRSALRKVAVDSDYRMRIDRLEQQLDECEAKHEDVIAVVAVVGTTEEGAVDPVDKILELREHRETTGKGSFWVHADAAYGGYLRTVTTPSRMGLGLPKTTVSIRGIEREIDLQLPEHYACDALERLGECDSITIDPHKLGYVPYPAGAICFKSNLVKPIARQDAPYIEDRPGNVEAERGSEAIGVYILEGSKPGAAAAAVWMAHTLIPLDTSGHGRLIQQTVRNACELHALLEKYPEWTGSKCVQAVCLCPPGSNIVCYAFRSSNASSLAEINRLNRTLYERFSGSELAGRRVYDQRFFVSRTTLSPKQYRIETVAPFLDRLGVSQDEFALEGVFLLRSVLMNPWYEAAKRKGKFYLSELVEELYDVAGQLVSESQNSR
jgi:glutamate/tyrosine decarboxylase-like PLP-dependent enzyme